MPYKETPKMMIIRGLMQVIVVYIICRYGDMYGYQIKLKVEGLHKKRIPHGVMYTTLKRMVRNGILSPYMKDGKTYYTVTEDGKLFLRNHLHILANADEIIREILEYYKS
ncbi:MAG: PadR family transcriptional regulator [Metallosphaera sp.]|uniref:PadR family transcriptional regulator n=1 Tax=Metallosphaera TaxID=41980 RepID=UPI00064F156E|nr:PadR family transcriptional regulator [Metallosphaera cuprina]